MIKRKKLRTKRKKVCTPKLPSISKLERELWMWFSKFIRRRDKYTCITCGKVSFPADCDAGHYVSRRHHKTKYCETNVNCQCKRCNIFLNGNMDEYAIALKRKYGQGVLEMLHADKHMTFKFSREWLTERIDYYKKRMEEPK